MSERYQVHFDMRKPSSVRCLSEMPREGGKRRLSRTPISVEFYTMLPQLTLEGILMRAIVEARQSGLRCTAMALHVALGVMSHEASDDQENR